MLAQHLVGRSAEPSPCGYDVCGLATNVASVRRTTRSETPKHLGMSEPHPARRFVLLARCRPSQERSRIGPGRSNLTGTDRVFSLQRASHCHSTPGVRRSRVRPFLPTPEGTGLPAGSG